MKAQSTDEDHDGAKPRADDGNRRYYERNKTVWKTGLAGAQEDTFS